jgi:hypothetical protein
MFAVPAYLTVVSVSEVEAAVDAEEARALVGSFADTLTTVPSSPCRANALPGTSKGVACSSQASPTMPSEVARASK